MKVSNSSPRSNARRRERFEKRAKQLQHEALAELQARFPPWYVRPEAPFQRTLVHGCVGGALMIGVTEIAAYAFGWPSWFFVAGGLTVVTFFFLTLGCMTATAVLAWAWTMRHPGHPYASESVRRRALERARDLYPFRHRVLEEFRGRFSAGALSELSALLPPTLAERAQDRPLWIRNEQRFWRRYNELMSAA